MSRQKTPVFEMLKRNGCVYTQIVKNYSTNDILPILCDSSNLSGYIIYSNYCAAYDGLIDF